MDMADLSDTEFSFTCDFADDACEYWDYTLSAKYNDYEFMRSMSSMDIEYLRKNCKRILQATDGIGQEGY